MHGPGSMVEEGKGSTVVDRSLFSIIELQNHATPRYFIFRLQNVDWLLHEINKKKIAFEEENS